MYMKHIKYLRIVQEKLWRLVGFFVALSIRSNLCVGGPL